MHPEMEQIKCVIMRGGTSKAVFINRQELPVDPAKRDAVIRAIYGSPDIRQIDGLGGADPLTSKLAIISAPTREGTDVDYTFAQVGIDTEVVDYLGNCGNISSAVGPYAIDEGLVRITEPVTTVRIHLTNTDNIIIAEVPVKGGKAAVEGDLALDGTPGTGAKITLDFSDTAGSLTKKLLPTGKPKDTIIVDGRQYEISLVDVANPLVFIKAEQLGMTGIETPQEIEANKSLMATIEKIRGISAQMLGLVERAEDAAAKSPYIPFFAIVSPPRSYRTFDGKNVDEKQVDIVSRLLFMLRMHKTYPITGTICTGAAVRIPGTVAWEVLREEAKTGVTVQIGHPAGIIPVEAEAEVKNGAVQIKRAAAYRTARRIMEGYVYVRKSVFK